MEVIGRGTIAIYTRKEKKSITNVFLVPSIGQNLLIVVQMIEKVYSLYFKVDACIINEKKDSPLNCKRSKWRKIGVLQFNEDIQVMWQWKYKWVSHDYVINDLDTSTSVVEDFPSERYDEKSPSDKGDWQSIWKRSSW